MALKKICILILCTFFFSLTFSGICQSSPEDIVSVFNMDYGVLKIDIKAPVESIPGENINVTIKTEGVPGIYVECLHVAINGALNATNKVTLQEITHLENYSFTGSSEVQEVQYSVAIPHDLPSGLTYGTINCGWELASLQETIPSSGFPMTYIRDLTLEQLRSEYELLNATHISLLEDYTGLESELKKEMDSTKNLVYIFIATTIVATITSIVLLLRKPKKVWI